MLTTHEFEQPLAEGQITLRNLLEGVIEDVSVPLLPGVSHNVNEDATPSPPFVAQRSPQNTYYEGLIS